MEVRVPFDLMRLVERLVLARVYPDEETAILELVRLGLSVHGVGRQDVGRGPRRPSDHLMEVLLPDSLHMDALDQAARPTGAHPARSHAACRETGDVSCACRHHRPRPMAADD